MILAGGKIYETSEQPRLLDSLAGEISRTRQTLSLDPEKVINAADKLGKRAAAGEFSGMISEFLPDFPQEYLRLAGEYLNGESLRFRLKQELGEYPVTRRTIAPPHGLESAEVRLLPLGTLFHIAAGNMDGLPAFSVLEGLLTGNVNILKLPQADNGITVEILRRLIEIEPEISPFVYVFDTPSTDVPAMKRMAAVSDGIVVWGGDEAVRAVRALAPPGAKLIEWGHKLGFAYISGYEDKPAELSALAKHIIDTRQLLCSSCQTIFIDAEDMEEIRAFCREFLPYLEAAAREAPVNDIGAAAEITLRKYSARLEEHIGAEKSGREEFRGERCSLTACPDSRLELSYMYGSCLVKPLPREQIVTALRECAGNLQTVGLLCRRESRGELTDILAAAGVNRIMRAGNMSVSFCGEAHDGEYPLRRYVRVVNVEK